MVFCQARALIVTFVEDFPLRHYYSLFERLDLMPPNMLPSFASLQDEATRELTSVSTRVRFTAEDGLAKSANEGSVRLSSPTPLIITFNPVLLQGSSVIGFFFGILNLPPLFGGSLRSAATLDGFGDTL